MTKIALAAPLILATFLTGCASQTAIQKAESPAVAKFGNETITLDELDQAITQELYELRQQALTDLISERLIESEAEAKGLSPEAYLEAEVTALIPEVEEDVARTFFEAYGPQLGPQFAGKTFEEVAPLIIEGMTSQMRGEAIPEIVEGLSEKADIQILLDPPRMDVEAIGFSKGPENAPIVIVEFSDFECPFCARGRDTMDQVLAAYSDDIKLVFRDYPLPFHANAMVAGEAGRCAGDQGQFWPMHDWMFSNQNKLTKADLIAAAGTLELDVALFQTCLDEGKHTAAVEADAKAGELLGVTGTPAFFINGILLSGAQPFEAFKSAIDDELTRIQGSN